MPVRIIVTAGTTHDSTQACALIEHITAEVLLADRGYDSNEIVAAAMQNGMKVCIPQKRNRKKQREAVMLPVRCAACVLAALPQDHRPQESVQPRRIWSEAGYLRNGWVFAGWIH